MLPTDPKARKAIPVSSGCFAYFPDALIALAQLSAIANEQHNPGEPLHWAKEKSTDEADALARHQLQHVKGELYDTDRVLHATKVFWRAGAQLQRLLTSGVAPLAPETKDPMDMTAWTRTRWDGDKIHVEIVDIFEPMTATEERIRQEHRLTKPTPHPPIFCFDCGVDLNERQHSPFCLALD